MNDKAIIDPDTPLPLAEAARICYPAGGMTVSGLRKEIRAGRLEFESVAGRHFVTARGIERMRALHRRAPVADELQQAS